MFTITNIKARQILDSRGNPTVEAEVYSGDTFGRAAVPSGASTGSKEALELRDGDASFYGGKSVHQVVKNIEEKIRPVLLGLEVEDQRGVDGKMLELDGSPNKNNLGANALLAVSLATARLGALGCGRPLYRYLRENLGCPNKRGDFLLPTPFMNIINGGQHASNNLDIQEFMIVPRIDGSFSDNLRAGVEVFHHLKGLLGQDGHCTNVGDEGGMAPHLEDQDKALDYMMKAMEKGGYRPGREMLIALDVAAGELFKEGSYHLQGKDYNHEKMTTYYQGLCDRYPICSIEDGLDENDYQGWQEMTTKLGQKIFLVGDDLFVTNKRIFQEGIDKGLANAILVKLNQIGTLTETFEAIEMADDNDYNVIISHRSGETTDTFIADLAVATGCGHIKTGPACRSDRVEKYNQLLRIEEELGSKARFRPICTL